MAIKEIVQTAGRPRVARARQGEAKTEGPR